jgi:hypothetical protein
MFPARGKLFVREKSPHENHQTEEINIFVTQLVHYPFYPVFEYPIQFAYPDDPCANVLQPSVRVVIAQIRVKIFNPPSNAGLSRRPELY